MTNIRQSQSKVDLLLCRGHASRLLLLCAFAGIFARVAPAAVLDPRTIQSATLHNGLRLVVCEEVDASVVSVEVIVRAGAAHEPPGQEGIAHLLEHVLWASGGTDDPRRRIEAIGGVVNGGTLRDYTRFYATVPAGHLHLAVGALADLVLGDSSDGAAILRESAVIQQESLGRRDQLRAILNQLAFEEVYGSDHPYRHSIDGSAQALATVGPTKLSLFQQTWYVPNNTAVVVVGDVDFDEVHAAVEGEFGHLVPSPLPTPFHQPLPRPATGRECVVTTKARDAYVMAAFVGPAAFERREVCASDLLATLLAHGPTGSLVEELVGNRGIATSAGIDFLTQRHRSLFGVWAVCDADDISAVKEGIRNELRRLAEDAIPPARFAAAKRLLSSGYAFANETPADRAATLAFYEAVDIYRSAGQYLPRVSLLGPSDVQEAASWYAGDPVWVVLTPKGAEQ